MNTIAIPLSKAAAPAVGRPFQVERRDFQAFSPDNKLESDVLGPEWKKLKRSNKDIILSIGDYKFDRNIYDTVSPWQPLLLQDFQNTSNFGTTSGVFENYFGTLKSPAVVNMDMDIDIYSALTFGGSDDIFGHRPYLSGNWNQSGFASTVMIGAGSINNQMASYAQIWDRARTFVFNVSTSMFGTTETSIVSPMSLRAASLLDDEDFEARVEEFLEEFDSVEGVRELAGIVSDDEHNQHRRKVAGILGEWDNPETFLERRRFLVDMLTGTQPGDRLAAASALGRLGDPSVVPAMRTQADRETSRIAKSVILANIASLERHAAISEATNQG